GPPEKPRRVWECWSTVADIDGLERWAQISGPSFQGLLVFVYQLDESIEFDSRIPDLWNFRNHRYLARAVLVNDYRANMRVRSPKWGTVDLPGKVFRSLVRPLAEFLELPEFLESPEPDEWN
ncbi:MAG: HYExAFE family protein, partial [Gemmataceae bacterium]